MRCSMEPLVGAQDRVVIFETNLHAVHRPTHRSLVLVELRLEFFSP
jgi:hypothetical protein